MTIKDTPMHKFGALLSKVLVKTSNVVGNTITDLVEGAVKGAREEIKKERKQ